MTSMKTGTGWTRGETHPKDVHWYAPKIPSAMLDPTVREVFETYSGIPADEVESHIYKIVRRSSANKLDSSKSDS